MIIHHYVPYTSNVGDLFVRDGIHKRVKEHFPDAQIIELPANDPAHALKGCIGLTGENLTRTNAEADMVIVGGSNLYQGPDWRFKTDLDSLKALNVPLYFIGLGVGSIRRGKGRPLDERSKNEIIFSHQKAAGVAVRDIKSAELLQTLGVKATVTGCPATFVGREPLKLNIPKKIVISAPPGRFVPRAWRKSFFQNGWMFYGFHRLLALLEKSDIDWQVIAHDAKDNEYLTPLLKKFGRTPFFPGMDTALCYEAFRQADLAICYRLHMGISCLGWGIPTVIADFDLRTSAFLDTMECRQIGFDAFGVFQIERMLNTIRQLLKNPEDYRAVYEHMLTRREYYWNETTSFYERMKTSHSKQ